MDQNHRDLYGNVLNVRSTLVHGGAGTVPAPVVGFTVHGGGLAYVPADEVDDLIETLTAARDAARQAAVDYQAP